MSIEESLSTEQVLNKVLNESDNSLRVDTEQETGFRRIEVTRAETNVTWRFYLDVAKTQLFKTIIIPFNDDGEISGDIQINPS